MTPEQTPERWDDGRVGMSPVRGVPETERIREIREKVALARAKQPGSLIVADFDYLLEALAALEQRLAETEAALRKIEAHPPLVYIHEFSDVRRIAREALRAEQDRAGVATREGTPPPTGASGFSQASAVAAASRPDSEALRAEPATGENEAA